MHAQILAYMFKLVECNKVKSALGPPNMDNALYIQEFVARLLKSAFPHLTDNQIKITVQGMINLNQDIPAFKEHLRDFLVQIMVSCRIPTCVEPYVPTMFECNIFARVTGVYWRR